MLSRSLARRIRLDTNSQLARQRLQPLNDRIVGRPGLREIGAQVAVEGKLLGQLIERIGAGPVGAGHGESRIGVRDLHAQFLPDAKAGVQG